MTMTYRPIISLGMRELYYHLRYSAGSYALGKYCEVWLDTRSHAMILMAAGTESRSDGDRFIGVRP